VLLAVPNPLGSLAGDAGYVAALAATVEVDARALLMSAPTAVADLIRTTIS
jgi:hypothetical protein